MHIQTIEYLKKFRSDDKCGDCDNNTGYELRREELLESSVPFCCLFCSPLSSRINPSPIEHILHFFWVALFLKRKTGFLKFEDLMDLKNEMFAKFVATYLQSNLPITIKKMIQRDKVSISDLKEDNFLIAPQDIDIKFEKDVKRIIYFKDILIINLI